jgi:hypothetical protein
VFITSYLIWTKCLILWMSGVHVEKSGRALWSLHNRQRNGDEEVRDPLMKY